MKKELIGWLDVYWGDTALYKTKEGLENGNPYTHSEKLTELIKDFHEKKVKIIIEVIE